jgi:hypothetical protein
MANRCCHPWQGLGKDLVNFLACAHLCFRYPPNGTFNVSLANHSNSLQILPSRANLTGIQSSTDPDLNGQSGIAFGGRRQTDLLFKFEIDLSFCPEKQGHEAGATEFFTQWQHLDIGIVFKPVLNKSSAVLPNIVLRTTNVTSTEISMPVQAAWFNESDKSIRFTIQAINTTHYRFSAGPVFDLNSAILLGDISSELVSSTWGYQAGSGSAIIVAVYATTNGALLDKNKTTASDSAYFSRWRYMGHGQEADFGTFVQVSVLVKSAKCCDSAPHMPQGMG